jgi:hypothetical protein
VFIKHLEATHQKNLLVQPPDHTIIIKADLQWSSTGNPIREGMAKLIYESCGDHYCNHSQNKKLDPYLCLYHGCELMLGENKDVIKGLANGTRGIFKGIRLKEGQNVHVTCLDGYFVNSVYASQVENVECEHTGSKHTGRFIIQPTKLKCIVDMPNPLIGGDTRRIKQSIHMTQVQLIRNLATTGHKLQGQTKESLVVSDLHYGLNWLYVVLSRVKTRGGLFMRTALDEYKLAEHQVDGRLLLHEEWLRANIPLR